MRFQKDPDTCGRGLVDKKALERAGSSNLFQSSNFAAFWPLLITQIFQYFFIMYALS